jgi:uncharacterized protein
MEPITYSLKLNQKDSTKYYEDISTFTDDVLSVSESFLTPIIEKFQFHLEKRGEKVPPYEECAFELLMPGTLWRTYGGRASQLSDEPQRLLANLANLRRKNESLKPYIDPLRGVMATIFLSGENENAYFPRLNIKSLDKLLKWLEATGEFKEESEHLQIWKDFLSLEESQKVTEYLKDILIFADWFKKTSKVFIGDYTSNVDKFLSDRHSEHLWQEDVIFCGRKGWSTTSIWWGQR